MKKSLIKYLIFFTIFFAITLYIAFSRAPQNKLKLDYNNLNYVNTTKHLEWKAKNKVIYVWAIWCSVCKVNLPILKFNNQIFGKIFNFHFLSVEEGSSDISDIEKYLNKNDIAFPVVKGDSFLLKKLGVYSYPTTIFINHKDEIKFVDSGIINPISYFLRIVFLNVL